MSIFKKYICSECSQKISYAAKQFSNGKLLCKKCASVLLASRLPSNISYEKYITIKEYQQKHYLDYQQLFCETHSYQNIHIDTKHLLLYIGDNIEANTIFLPFKNVTSCNIGYSVSPGATSTFGTAPCTVTISIKINHPDILYRYNLHDRVKTTYEDSEYYVDIWGDDFYSDIYSYKWPSALLSFLKTFYGACKKTEELYDIEPGEFDESEFSYVRGRNKEDSWEYQLRLQNKDYYDQSDKELEEESKVEFYETIACTSNVKQEISEEEYMEFIDFLNNKD